MSGLFLIVRRSLRQHAVSTTITVLSVALASGLVISVFAINEQTNRAFTATPGFDAILGARGSETQLVLNTIYHLETSPGNIPWTFYKSLKEDRRVELAVPYAVGDNYKGYRIVGTTGDIFERFEYRKGQTFELQGSGGRFFDTERREAVIGSHVASQLGMRVGSVFSPYHGVIYDEREKHDEEYVVVGVLEPTNTPSDRVIWIPIEGIFRMSNHVLKGSGDIYRPEAGVEIPDEHKEVSAVMLKFRGAINGQYFSHLFNNQGREATLVWPIAPVMIKLLGKLGWMHKVLQLVAYMVVAVAAGSILASLYNTMNERRREFAILRSLGARKRTVFSVIVMESTAIALLGSLLGWLVYALVLAAAAWIIRRETGVVIDVFELHPILYQVPAGMILLGVLAGTLPAFKAYATDVASNLIPTS